MQNSEYTSDWESYESCLAYQSKINLLPQTDKNYRFYGNNHWKGVKNAEKLTLTIIPLTQQVVDLKVAVVMSDSLAMNFSVLGVSDDTKDPNEMEQRKMAKQLSAYAKTVWENLKVDFMNENGLLDAAITGDYYSFWYWDEMINAGNGQMGEMCGEQIDNVNYFPDDPNLDEINNAYGPVQTGITLSFIRSVEDERQIAKANGVSTEDIAKIVADADARLKQSGDASKNNLNNEDKNGNCIVLLRLWKEMEIVKGEITDPETGEVKEITKERIWHIKARRSVKSVVIKKDYDTGLHRYPVAGMHWRKKKGSAYGDAEVTSLIPNQLVINKLASMIATWITKHGFPKVLFDKTRISSWTNDLSVAIGVNGTDTGGVQGAAGYMLPAQLSMAVQNFMVWFIETTKKSFGASEAILGEATGTNYAANALNSQNAIIPLNGQKHRFYNYNEDVGLIWLDIWLSKYKEYPNRKLEIQGKDANKKDIKTVVDFDANKLDGVRLKLKIDIGPSTQWNQNAVNQRLDMLLKETHLNFVEYLERLSDGTVPDAESLIEARNGQEAQQRNNDKQILYELMSRFMETVSPEIKKKLDEMKQNDPQGYEQQVKQLVMSTPPQQAQQDTQQPKGPSESINFKDLPVEGQVQMAAQAGIQLTPQAIAQQQANQQAAAMRAKQNTNNGGKNNAKV